MINKINALEEELLKANQKLKEKDKINEQLKSDLSKKDNKIKESNSNLIKLEAKMKIKDIELKRLKIDLNVKKEENKDNKLIEVKIVSSNKNIKINTVNTLSWNIRIWTKKNIFFSNNQREW